MSSAQYRLVAAGGGGAGSAESGSGDVTVADGILQLQPAGGTALRIPSSRIASVAEPEPFTILVTLTDGTALELSRLGRMRTQLLEELRDARAEVAAAESGTVGGAARFTGTVAADSADVHVFEDALLVIAGGRPRRIAFSFVTDVRAVDYTVTISLAGGAQVPVTRLGRRTDEFVTLLRDRLGESHTRTAAFLGSLLPGLDPMALRAAAGLLRDGVAAPAGALDAIHPDLSATLLRVAALPDRCTAISGLTGISGLAGRAGLALGFKQVTSVRRPAAGGTPWHDPAVTPHIGQHDSPEGLFGPGLGGAMAAGMMSGMGPGGGGFGLGGGMGGYGMGGYGGYGYGGPFGGGPGGYGGMGGMGGYWAFRALGAGMNWNSGGAQHQMTPRADVRRGLLTPETEDLSALTAAGEDPTVLAFALLSAPGDAGAVAYEVLNLPEPLTYVYRGPGQSSTAAVNQALDDAGFAAAGLHAAASGGLTAAHRQDAAASPLTSALIGTVAHDDIWASQLAGFLTG